MHVTTGRSEEGPCPKWHGRVSAWVVLTVRPGCRTPDVMQTVYEGPAVRVALVSWWATARVSSLQEVALQDQFGARTPGDVTSRVDILAVVYLLLPCWWGSRDSSLRALSYFPPPFHAMLLLLVSYCGHDGTACPPARPVCMRRCARTTQLYLLMLATSVGGLPSACLRRLADPDVQQAE